MIIIITGVSRVLALLGAMSQAQGVEDLLRILRLFRYHAIITRRIGASPGPDSQVPTLVAVRHRARERPLRSDGASQLNGRGAA